MTPENDDRRPPQEPDTQPEKSKSTLEALNDTRRRAKKPARR